MRLKLPMDLVIGRALDVRVRPRLVEERRLSRDRVRRIYELDLTNAKSVPVTVEIRHDPSAPRFKVMSEPQKHDIRQGQVAWRVRLAAGEQQTFRYAVAFGR